MKLGYEPIVDRSGQCGRVADGGPFLEELKLDYEDFLRRQGLTQWERENPLRQGLIDQRCETADAVAAWVVEVAK